MIPAKRMLVGFLIAAALWPSPAQGQLIPPPATDKKIAAIVTTYHRYSHADNIVTRFMEGYGFEGESFPPPCKVASLYIEQVTDIDIGRPLARQWGVKLAKTPAEALTLGGNKLAVDGVLIIGEHGNYPVNDKGQKLYPRRRFFEEAIKVFRATGKSVPVFVDKHLAYQWEDARWMYDQHKELGFPMMAGSSVPVAPRKPSLQPEIGIQWTSALCFGYGSPTYAEGFGYHALEGLQVMTERRKGGETGVRAVQYLKGKAAWEAVKAGKCDRALLDAAIKDLPGRSKGKIEEDDHDAIVYLIEYADGLHASVYLSPRHCHEYAFAGLAKEKTEPLTCWYRYPRPQRDPFAHQVHAVGQMMVTGKATYPVERTLLTTGMVDALNESRITGKRIETPHLAIKYAAP